MASDFPISPDFDTAALKHPKILHYLATRFSLPAQSAYLLCLEQIKKEDGRFYRNTPEDWNNILFDVYMQSGITDKQIELFNRWLFLAALFAIIPIIYLVNRFFVIIKWNLVEGIIEDVTLVNDFNQPYTEAHIIFKTKDNMEHECRFTIGHYGDYEEGIEPELENMLQSDKELFMKKKVPVFYSPKDVNRCIVYLEDSQ